MAGDSAVKCGEGHIGGIWRCKEDVFDLSTTIERGKVKLVEKM